MIRCSFLYLFRLLKQKKSFSSFREKMLLHSNKKTVIMQITVFK
ncbi:hypothetical protein B4134_2031 [Bacillus safensis]|nr:hypothetical protein B4134_2031 [Bacillus safensis]